MKKISTLVLVCCLCAGLVACGMSAENISTHATSNQTGTTYTTEPIATIPTDARVEIPEITLEMLRLSHHCEEIEVHCNPWECHWDCNEHCDERCVQHAPTYVGIPVHAPEGFIYVVARFTPEERDAVGSFDLGNTFVMYVLPDTKFEVAGVQYWSNLNGDLDPERDSDYPLTEEEMGELCAAIPISTERMGLEYLIDPTTGDFLVVVPNHLEVVPNWWK